MSVKPETCLLLKLGSCRACDNVQKAQRKFRWTPMSPEQASREVGQLLCPSGLKPSVELLINTEASFTMGARRVENTVFDGTMDSIA